MVEVVKMVCLEEVDERGGGGSVKRYGVVGLM